MRIASAVLSLACMGIFASAAYAYIPPSAPSAAHDNENKAVAIHDYLHALGGGSYGAHGLDNTAVALHDALHDWSNGTASEADVAAARDAAWGAFRTFVQNIVPAGVLFRGDDTLDQMFFDVFRSSVKIRVLTARAK